MRFEGERLRQRRFGLVINVGIEYRNLLLSGLASELKRFGDVVVLRRDFESAFLDDYLEEFQVPEIRIPRDWFSGSRLPVEGYFSASRKARKRLLGVGNFHNYRAVSGGGPTDFLKGNRLSHALLERATIKAIPNHYADEEMCRLIKDEGITDVFLGGYSSVGVMRWTRSAAVAGINTWVVVNSWKDLFVNDFVPFSPTGLFVWSETMKWDFLKLNHRLKSEAVFPVGNPIFDRFFNYRPSRGIEYYARKYGFDENRPMVVYSMINPVAYDREHLIIRAIDQKLEEAFEPEKRPVVVLRRNPFEVDPSTQALYDGLRNCVLAEHHWERDEALDVSVQALEGEVEWTDLLFHSITSMHIASTVALESLLLGKPVVNIGFGPDGLSDEACLRYAQAPFYGELVGRGDVMVVESIAQCMNSLIEVLAGNVPSERQPRVVGRMDGLSVAKIGSLV